MNSLARIDLPTIHCGYYLLLTTLVHLSSLAMASPSPSGLNPNFYYRTRTLNRRSTPFNDNRAEEESESDNESDALLKDLGYGYNLPECLPNEACLYRAFEHRFEMCQCPGAKLDVEGDVDEESGEGECPEKGGNAVRSQGITYNFCNSSTVISACRTGQLSMTVKGLRSIIHCRCRSHTTHMLRKKRVADGETQFFCELKTDTNGVGSGQEGRRLRRL